MMKTPKHKDTPEPSILLGGQAVLEGVMMRGPARIATAVRRADGTIAVHAETFTPLGQRVKALSLPILRGAVGMIEMLVVGIRALAIFPRMWRWSLSAATDGSRTKRPPTPVALAGTVIVALLLGLLLFFVTPLLITTFLFDVEREAVIFNVTAGIIRMVLFLVYLVVIAQLQDIQRLFAYHGAEHKSVLRMNRDAPFD